MDSVDPCRLAHYPRIKHYGGWGPNGNGEDYGPRRVEAMFAPAHVDAIYGSSRRQVKRYVPGAYRRRRRSYVDRTRTGGVQVRRQWMVKRCFPRREKERVPRAVASFLF